MIIPLFNPLLDGLRHLRQRLLLHHNMVFHKSKRLIPVNRKTCAFLKCGIPQRCPVPMDALNNKASAIGNNRLPDKRFHCFNPALIFNDILGRIFFVRNFCFFINNRFRSYFFFRSVFSVKQRKLSKRILLQSFKAFPHTLIMPVCGICTVQNHTHGLQNLFHFFLIGKLIENTSRCGIIIILRMEGHSRRICITFEKVINTSGNLLFLILWNLF